MHENPVLKYIHIYPVKSLDGISVPAAQIGNGGSLVHDREYAILDANGKYVNGKSNARVHLLRLQIDFGENVLSLKQEKELNWNRFSLEHDLKYIDIYLSAFFNQPVSLQRNTEGRFLDVPVKSGLTVLSTASLEKVAGWYTDLPLEETRRRMRATLEIEQVPAFWEDRLFNASDTPVRFRVGDVILAGRAPRERCVVPSRHPASGKTVRGFQKIFARERNASLPGWSKLDEFGHSYYLSVDCSVPVSELGKWIKAGDPVSII